MEDWQREDFDAVIIGSGPGGATVANELSKRGKSCLILEKGRGAQVRGTMWQCVTTALVPGRSLFFTPELLALIRGITVGGSSVLAYGCALDPPFEMFDSYGIDLRDEVEETKQELPLAPLSDALVGPAAQRIMDSARELGYDWSKIPKIVYQDECRLNCDKCTMGCPYGAKWTARMSIDEACQRGSVLLTGATVKGVLTDNHKATGVVFSVRGRRQQASAPLIVVAAGGIGTPLILRAAGIRRAGHDFFCDPLVVAMGTVEDLNGGREFPMVAGYRDEAAGYLMTDLVWPGWTYAAFTAQALRLDRLASHRRTLPIMVKIKDELGGRITDRGGVRKWLTASDRKKLTDGYGKARQILANAGAHHIYKTRTMATHPGGTAKINDVVDSNLKTELDNLFVCDCSVIPQSWGMPPTLTIIALGRRLAKHLEAVS